MQLANAFATVTLSATLLLCPMAAQQVLRYSDAEEIRRSSDSPIHVLVLTLSTNGRVDSATLEVDGGSASSSYQVELSARTGGRRVVLQGRHTEHGLITVAGTRADDEFRGAIQVDEQLRESIHLRRVRD